MKFEIGKCYYIYTFGNEYFDIIDKSDNKITYKTSGVIRTVPLYTDDEEGYEYFRYTSHYWNGRVNSMRVAIREDGMVRPV